MNARIHTSQTTDGSTTATQRLGQVADITATEATRWLEQSQVSAHPAGCGNQKRRAVNVSRYDLMRCAFYMMGPQL